MRNAEEIYAVIEKTLHDREDKRIEYHPLIYRTRAWRLMRVASASIAAEDPVLLIQAGIHGDEISGPITLARHAEQIFMHAHDKGVKLIIYPLANPSGFDLRRRYSADHRPGDPGNADYLRYELDDGRITDELPSQQQTFKRWHWSSDQVTLPPETTLLQKLLRRDPLAQVRAALDLHQDLFTEAAPPAAYHYSFGDFSRYRAIVEELRAIVPILAHTALDAGYAHSTQPTPTSDADGFILRHDGSLSDLFHRLGAEHSITAETTGVTPLDLACRVNLIWIRGLIELIA